MYTGFKRVYTCQFNLYASINQTQESKPRSISQLNWFKIILKKMNSLKNFYLQRAQQFEDYSQNTHQGLYSSCHGVREEMLYKSGNPLKI